MDGGLGLWVLDTKGDVWACLVVSQRPRCAGWVWWCCLGFSCGALGCMYYACGADDTFFAPLTASTSSRRKLPPPRCVSPVIPAICNYALCGRSFSLVWCLAALCHYTFCKLFARPSSVLRSQRAAAPIRIRRLLPQLVLFPCLFMLIALRLSFVRFRACTALFSQPLAFVCSLERAFPGPTVSLICYLYVPVLATLRRAGASPFTLFPSCFVFTGVLLCLA